MNVVASAIKVARGRIKKLGEVASVGIVMIRSEVLIGAGRSQHSIGGETLDLLIEQ